MELSGRGYRLMKEVTNIFREANPNITDDDMKRFSPVQLAYIGDAVYELSVRTYLINRSYSNLFRQKLNRI